jgi:nitric oxide reductase NorD protein
MQDGPASPLAGLTPLADVQRSLALFVRGLHPEGTSARRLTVHVAPPGVRRAFANELGLFFPERFTQLSGVQGRQVFFAAAAHLVAHLRFGSAPWRRGSLRPIQVVLVSLFEDARVERLLARELPGLVRLWAPYHTAQATAHETFPSLCARISRALFDAAYEDSHPLVDRARRFFPAGVVLSNADLCREFGSLLGNDVGQTRLGFSEREYLAEPLYRDDHRLLWEERPHEQQPVHEHAEQLERARASAGQRPQRQPPPRRAASVRAVEQTEEGSQVDTRSDLPLEPEQSASVLPIEVRYPEYDYQIRVSRPAFCTVREQPRRSAGEGQALPDGRPLSPALVRLAGTLRVETLRKRKRERDGDTVDLDAALEARIDLQARHTPEDRVYVRTARRRLPLAVLMLLDLSQSTSARVPNTNATLLDLARDACLLLGDVLARVGDPFAVHGFSSNGRHEVEYHRFKDFAEPWDAAARARLSSLEPRLSTRMGAALRHAARALSELRAERRLLLLLTDGEPADIDCPDPDYLLFDARHVVQQTRRHDVGVFAVSVDRDGAPYLSRIFGQGRYVVLPRIEHLPRALTSLYAHLGH